MCGIAGFVDFNPQDDRTLLQRARAMADALAYRGPDASGYWADARSGFATGHRRLSIVDLTEAGAQPMLSRSGRFVISYNGEVYNGEDLRPELAEKGYTFRGHSDTEVILEGCEAWGVPATVRRLIGMFAIAIWDRQNRKLWLVRDRLGIKPLYWGRFGHLKLFSSELKGLRAHPGWDVEIDRDSMAAFARFGYIPAPRSIYRNVYKLPPGTILEIEANREPRIEPFWSLQDAVRNGRRNRFQGDDAAAEESLAKLVADAVRRRMVADVPLGAFLSGGIDSSTVVAMMQSQSSQPVRTFSIGFTEENYNEAQHAKAVAQHLKTDHTELYVTPEEARHVIPQLPNMYDEPFADSSQIPTYLVSALTRRHVTVALSGDGGDELFCGYNRYFHAASLQPKIKMLPTPLQRMTAAGLRWMPAAAINRLQLFAPTALALPPQLGDKLHKLAKVMTASEDETYLSLLSHWHHPTDIIEGSTEPANLVLSNEVHALMPDYVERMQYIDALTYLPDDILTKVDRASMAVSLEARVPLLDHRVVEFAWSLPSEMKIRNGKGKWLLRQVLRRFVPDALVERPKMGFGVPIDEWLRGPLRDWANSYLSADALKNNGINPTLIQARWHAHLEGRENWQYPLWTIITLQAWLESHAGSTRPVKTEARSAIVTS
jgi:asparagine synthase (glutamine-hydrolysing)